MFKCCTKVERFFCGFLASPCSSSQHYLCKKCVYVSGSLTMHNFRRVWLQFSGYLQARHLSRLFACIECPGISQETIEFEQTAMFVGTGETRAYVPCYDAPAGDAPW